MRAGGCAIIQTDASKLPATNHVPQLSISTNYLKLV